MSVRVERRMKLASILPWRILTFCNEAYTAAAAAGFAEVREDMAAIEVHAVHVVVECSR